MVAAFFLAALLTFLGAILPAYLLQSQHGHGAGDGIGVLACAEGPLRGFRPDADFIQAVGQGLLPLPFLSNHSHYIPSRAAK